MGMGGGSGTLPRDKITISKLSYEEARKQGKVEELELILKTAYGEDQSSIGQATDNLCLRAIDLGATHIFSREYKTIGKTYSPHFKHVTYGHAYGPKKGGNE